MKRIFAMTLSLIMLFTMLPFVGVAESRDSICRCENPVPTDWWFYGSTDCTDPTQELTRATYCGKCRGIFSEVIPTQSSHTLIDLDMYDEDGKLIIGSDGKPNYLAPTCEEKGYIRKQCKICYKIVEEVIDEKGHTYGAFETYIKCFSANDPKDNAEEPMVTNLTVGISRSYCLNGCGAYLEERSNGHSIHETGEVAASCFGDGHSGYKYCVTCGTESYTVVTPKLSHKDEDGNGKCDLCLSQYREADGVYCSCMCHSENSFIQLIMPLLKLVWQLLGVDNCHGDCDAVHYVKE